jgi:hypothetical protein
MWAAGKGRAGKLSSCIHFRIRVDTETETALVGGEADRRSLRSTASLTGRTHSSLEVAFAEPWGGTFPPLALDTLVVF